MPSSATSSASEIAPKLAGSVASRSSAPPIARRRLSLRPPRPRATDAVLDEGAKVNHLTYIGDAHIGEKTNIGAGTITCNYDGVFKHRTEIGARAFIGSNTMLVAPVKVGAEAMTASGAVITKEVPEGALAISRADQVNKLGLARKLFEMLKSKKASQAGSKG